MLNLSDTAVTNACVKSIKQMPNLRELRIAGTKVTDQGVGELKTILPECEIVRGP